MPQTYDVASPHGQLVVKFTHRPGEQIDSTIDLASEACWLGFPYLKDFSLSGFLFPRNSVVDGRSRTLTFSLGFSILLWTAFHTTFIASGALTFCCPLYTISTVFFFLCPFTCPWSAASPEAGFSNCFHEKINPSYAYSARSIGPPSVELWCSLAIHF